MSETKFTPGPWEVRRGEPWVIAKAYGNMKSVVHLNYPITQSEEQQANAHLIATAPELYETLEAIIARWDTPLWKDIEPTAVFIGKGRAALAKARGEA